MTRPGSCRWPRSLIIMPRRTSSFAFHSQTVEAGADKNRIATALAAGYKPLWAQLRLPSMHLRRTSSSAPALHSPLLLTLRQANLVQINIGCTGPRFGCCAQTLDLHDPNAKEVLEDDHAGHTSFELSSGHHLCMRRLQRSSLRSAPELRQQMS